MPCSPCTKCTLWIMQSNQATHQYSFVSFVPATWRAGTFCTPPSDDDTNDGWMIYQDNLQTIMYGLSEWAVHQCRQTGGWWTSVWTENCVCCPLLSQPSDKAWDKHTILYCKYSGMGGVDGRQRRGMDVGERTPQWVGACGQGTGRWVSFQAVPAPAMKTWAKCV